MASSFGGGIAGLAGCYILFGGKINVPFIMNCILGSLASIAGNCYYGTFYKLCRTNLPFLESLLVHINLHHLFFANAFENFLFLF